MGLLEHPAARAGPGMNRRQVARNAGNDREDYGPAPIWVTLDTLN